MNLFNHIKTNDRPQTCSKSIQLSFSSTLTREKPFKQLKNYRLPWNFFFQSQRKRSSFARSKFIFPTTSWPAIANRPHPHVPHTPRTLGYCGINYLSLIFETTFFLCALCFECGVHDLHKRFPVAGRTELVMVERGGFGKVFSQAAGLGGGWRIAKLLKKGHGAQGARKYYEIIKRN